MTPSEVLAAFVNRVLVAPKARRLAALVATKKGQRKILLSLSHEFDSAIRSNITQVPESDPFWDKPCFVFHSQLGFGVSFSTVSDAYNQLSLEDSWLILLQDGSMGIYRPENRWNEEKWILG